MTKTQSLISVAAVLAIGFFLGSSVGPNASAQVAPPSPPARFQISAYAYPGNQTNAAAKHGCYILDTVTGTLWHSGPDSGHDSLNRPLKLIDKLP